MISWFFASQMLSNRPTHHKKIKKYWDSTTEKVFPFWNFGTTPLTTYLPIDYWISKRSRIWTFFASPTYIPAVDSRTTCAKRVQNRTTSSDLSIFWGHRKSTFKTKYVRFQFLTTSMGFQNTPDTFQTLRSLIIDESPDNFFMTHFWKISSSMKIPKQTTFYIPAQSFSVSMAINCSIKKLTAM